MVKAKRKASSGRTKDQGQESSNEKPQKYDETLKKWITQGVDEILPILATGVEYEQELNVEFSRSMMRADKVFEVRYHGKPYILNIEFQVGRDDDLPARLLLYNAALHYKFHLPVISMVIYPFEVKMAVPPLVIPTSEEDCLIFPFKTIPLFLLYAETYVQNHQTCMYSVLPAMLGFHADMAVQVMHEMSDRYHDDRTTLIEQFICLQLCIDRTGTIELPEKIHIQERLSMFDQLWEESPTIQKMRAEYLQKGLQEGRQEGLQEGLQKGRQKGLQEGRQEERQEALQRELQRLRHLLVSIIQPKYPDLVALAQQQATHFDNPEILLFLIQQVATAPNADIVRWHLEQKTM